MRIMDEETKKSLIGLLPFDIGARYSFTPERFSGVPEDFRPVYILKALTRKEAQDARKCFLSLIEDKEVNNEAISEIAGRFLVAWENQYDCGTGEPIPFNHGNVSKLPVFVIRDILYEGLKISGLLDIEKKSLVS